MSDERSSNRRIRALDTYAEKPKDALQVVLDQSVANQSVTDQSITDREAVTSWDHAESEWGKFLNVLRHASVLRHADVGGPGCNTRAKATPCLLKQLLEIDEDAWEDGQRQFVASLIESGWTLRSQWPRSWAAEVRGLLGQRLYLLQERHSSETARLASIVSSQLGRHLRNLPSWPTWLDSALQHLRRQAQTLLVAPKTTLACTVSEFAETAKLPVVTLDLPRKSESPSQWIRRWFQLLREGNDYASDIFISPEIAGPICSEGPLQDVAAIVLSDIVYALSIRRGGSIERLLRWRLAASDFPEASIFIRLGSTDQRSQEVEHAAWLDDGAVGWWTSHESQDEPLRTLSRCMSQGEPSVYQLTSRIPGVWVGPTGESRREPQTGWDWLTHCTRGTVGPLPEEDHSHYLDRVWASGHIGVDHPIISLDRICRQRRLLGTSQITRTSNRCVCFSSVPLPELLAARNFKAHLGRWDWEPYGLLIRRDSLEALGGREVLYGTETDYQSLPEEERLFFQPAQSESGHKLDPYDWTQEREWRLPGDLDLSRLPFDAIRIFVQTRTEALHFARRYPWPVWWVNS